MLTKTGKRKLMALCSLLLLLFIGLISSTSIMARTDTSPIVVKNIIGKYFTTNNLTFETGTDLYKLIGNTTHLAKYIGMTVEITGIIDGSVGNVCPPKGIMMPCRTLKNLIVISYKVL
jgi:hypothetical protein